MKPASFDYHRPDSVEQAVGLLAELGQDAKILAGGQSLVPMLSMRLAYFDHLIDISRLGELQGIGGALMEDLAYDDDGNPLATTFVDYLLPTATEVPPIEFGHVEIPGPGPGGYKGAGEGGAIGSVPAVINAINDALAPLGVTITRLPASPASIASRLTEAGR